MTIQQSESLLSLNFSSVCSRSVSRHFENSNPVQIGHSSQSTCHPLRRRVASWTKYCALCSFCGAIAILLAATFLVVAAIIRYHTSSVHYFETVPTYLPSILLSICGVSTVAFSCKRNRNIILLRITACWSLMSAALSSVITITTSLIHMNRLQTLKECIYTRSPPSCTCFGQFSGVDGVSSGVEPHHFVFENTVGCDVIHGVLYSCLRTIFAISVVSVLLSIFLCMLLHQLIGHERKKSYWAQIRRINSDWSSEFVSSISRPYLNERLILPLISGSSSSIVLGVMGSRSMFSLAQSYNGPRGPPPAYESSDLQQVNEGILSNSTLQNEVDIQHSRDALVPLSVMHKEYGNQGSDNTNMSVTC